MSSIGESAVRYEMEDQLSDAREHLAEAGEHIARAVERIAAQEVRVGNKNSDMLEWKELLRTRDRLSIMHNHLSVLQKELSHATVEGLAT
jgi:hypothetical protein